MGNHQDSTGKPIKVGDRVRYNGAEYVIDRFVPDCRVVLHGDRGAATAMEYSVDLVTAPQTPRLKPSFDINCETPDCPGHLYATGADGVGRCLSCLRAYRDGMAQVAEMGPMTLDACLDALAKLLGPREERDRPRRVEVVERETLLAENFAKQTGRAVDVSLANALIPPSMSDALRSSIQVEPMCDNPLDLIASSTPEQRAKLREEWKALEDSCSPTIVPDQSVPPSVVIVTTREMDLRKLLMTWAHEAEKGRGCSCPGVVARLTCSAEVPCKTHGCPRCKGKRP